ncbi:MAG: hypothetical protein QXI42_11870 [Thermoproteota archaeon]
MKGISTSLELIVLSVLAVALTFGAIYIVLNQTSLSGLNVMISHSSLLQDEISLTLKNVGLTNIHEVYVVSLHDRDGRDLLHGGKFFQENPVQVNVSPGQDATVNFVITAPVFHGKSVAQNVVEGNFPLGSSVQRKVFFVNGVHIVFYVDSSSRIVYRTSLNGLDWSQPNIILGNVAGGQTFSVFVFENFLHFAYASGVKGEPLKYCMGTVYPNGTILWNPMQNAVPGDNRKSYAVPCVAVDSDGYPWIVCVSSDGVVAVKSSTKNGVWTTEAGFPYIVEGNPSTNVQATIVPLSDKKMYVAWYSPNTKLSGRLWSGQTFGPEEDISHNVPVSKVSLSATSYGDRVYVAYTMYAKEDLVYLSSRVDNGWSTPEAVVSNITPPTHLSTTATCDGGVYVYWTTYNGSNYILGCRFKGTDGGWTEVITLDSSSKDEIYAVSSSYQESGNIVPVAYCRSNTIQYLYFNTVPNIRAFYPYTITVCVKDDLGNSRTVQFKVESYFSS